MLLFSMLVACTGKAPVDSDTGPQTVPWSRELPESAETAPPRGFLARRSIVHLHSPWSHDACDGEPLPNGLPDEDCLQDLRGGLCDTRVDMAFLTDHPAHAAYQPYDDLFHHRDGDEWVDVDGKHRANRIHCESGHVVTWVPGIEDELMPVGLDRHVSLDSTENDAIYNSYDATGVDSEEAAGAHVFTAHTEQRNLVDLSMLQDAGLAGTELFNLHAAFAPDIRSEFLGLDATSWFADIAPFMDDQGTAEPDLFVLAVLGEQTPSVALWDGLLARGPMTGTAGTDAHQNVLPMLFRDGERGDSYRRMLRWFSNVVLASSDDPVVVEAALASSRSYVAFEILGTPEGFDFHLEPTSGDVVEMGGEGSAGTIVAECPVLSTSSPRGLDAPEVTATVFKDGVAWATGCGDHPTDGPGVYRVRVDIVPYHLRGFLGADPEPWMRAFPWVYSNAIRVR